MLFPLFAQLDLPSANEEDEKAVAAASVSSAKDQGGNSVGNILASVLA